MRAFRSPAMRATRDHCDPRLDRGEARSPLDGAVVPQSLPVPCHCSSDWPEVLGAHFQTYERARPGAAVGRIRLPGDRRSCRRLGLAAAADTGLMSFVAMGASTSSAASIIYVPCSPLRRWAPGFGRREDRDCFHGGA